METLRSVCALDCPDTCAILVQVENGRAARLRGDPRHPVTRGFLCGKVAQYLEREYSPERLLYPRSASAPRAPGSSSASAGNKRSMPSPKDSAQSLAISDRSQFCP